MWHSPRLLNAVANAMLALVMLAAIGTAVWWVAHRPMFTLRAMVVEPMPGKAMTHVSDSLLRASGVRRVPGNFFTVDLQAVRAAFEAVPWVRRAAVRRVWPNRLHVAIEEHRIFAAWTAGRFLNTFGEPFWVNPGEVEEDGPLPALAGPDGSELEVLRRFVELTGQLQPLGTRPVSLALSARHAWSAELAGGTTLTLGRDQGLSIRERVDRFVHAYPDLAARTGQWPRVIDLRYPNGFAIRLADAQVSIPTGRTGQSGAPKAAKR